MKLTKRTFIALSLSLFVLTAGLAAPFSCIASAADGLPEDGIARFNAALLDSMKNADKLGMEGRYKVLEPVIKDVFSLPFMAAKAMGGHWDKLTPAQRALYVDVYTDWTIATYAGRFDGWGGESFIQSRSAALNQQTVPVKSSILKADGDHIVDFTYLMRKFPGGWQVVDIRILGVSQLALTRAQFIYVLAEDGFDGLIEMLRKKTKAFYVKGH